MFVENTATPCLIGFGRGVRGGLEGQLGVPQEDENNVYCVGPTESNFLLL